MEGFTAGEASARSWKVITTGELWSSGRQDTHSCLRSRGGRVRCYLTHSLTPAESPITDLTCELCHAQPDSPDQEQR
ncbi:hypothetical protein E2C01_003727 [Portunus trituberculatus]|uniref:Uncharacterized protein n=1 Tax=Portunus trituberculatus TaxID=210409 RepID=A0A5B7CQZ0_PORTR|nr:hypothetical protein [Portunus trituberculatus]